MSTLRKFLAVSVVFGLVAFPLVALAQDAVVALPECVSVEYREKNPANCVGSPFALPHEAADVMKTTGGDPLIHDIDVIQTSQQIYTGVTTGNWWLVASLVLVVIVFAIRKYGSRYFPKAAPYLRNPLISFALPVLMSSFGAMATALTSGGDIKIALMAGLKVAMGAVWLYVGKVKFEEVREEAKEKAAAQVPNTNAATNVHVNGPGPQI